MADLLVVAPKPAKSDAPSRAELIANRDSVLRAFALTRATMAMVILGTAFLQGLEAQGSGLFLVQLAVVGAAIIGLLLSVRTLIHSLAEVPRLSGRPWPYIALDSVLALGVMTMIDVESSPLAWVALIAPVLETAVLFSVVPAGAIWVGLSLAFLALRITAGDSESTGSETMILSLQQVLAVLLVSGPAALMADNAQHRLDRLADARRSADETADRLRRVAEGAQRMSQEESTGSILAIAAQSAVAIGFDQADVVLCSPDGATTLHSAHSVGEHRPVPLDVLTSLVDSNDIASITSDDHEHGASLRLTKIVSGHAFSLGTHSDVNASSTSAVLRAWSRISGAADHDLQALSLLGGQTREILRAAVVLDRAKAHANQLQHEVRHDGLTGLANRAFLLETLEQRIKSRSGTALFFIDLDGFKSLNDTIGHRAGDAALVTVSERLNALAPTGSLVGRMGGDEFIVMTPVGRTDTLETLHRFGDSVAQLIGEPMLCDGHEARVGASVGLAVHDGVVGADQLISRADAAMYEAKRDGGGLRVDPKSAGLERKDRSLL